MKTIICMGIYLLCFTITFAGEADRKAAEKRRAFIDSRKKIKENQEKIHDKELMLANTFYTYENYIQNVYGIVDNKIERYIKANGKIIDIRNNNVLIQFDQIYYLYFDTSINTRRIGEPFELFNFYAGDAEKYNLNGKTYQVITIKSFGSWYSGYHSYKNYHEWYNKLSDFEKRKHIETLIQNN